MLKIAPYAPLNALKPLAEDIWIVDGPVIAMKYLWVGSLPFSTRMTVVRLDDGGLWLHSPTEMTPALRAEIDALGPVRALVAPNRLHWRWLGDWQAAYPRARVFAAPKVAGAAAGRARVDEDLGEAAPALWAGQIDQILTIGGYMTEVEFFHRRSRTLILTDMIENFEPSKIGGALTRWIMRIGGVLAPNGGMPRDLRLTFLGRRRAVRAAVETMIAWNPARIVIAHGAMIETDAPGALRRAFAWTGLR